MVKRTETERRVRRLHAADKVARELRFLIAENGGVDRNNSTRLLKYMHRWMSFGDKDQYERPPV